MKTLILLLFTFIISTTQAQRNCIYDFEEKTDSTHIQALPNQLIHEKVFGNSTHLLLFSLLQNNGMPLLKIQYLQKSKDMLLSNCFDKSSRIFLQLQNGKVVTLLPYQEETCSQYSYDPQNKNNIRILEAYFMFGKEGYEELKKYPVTLLRIKYVAEVVDYALNKQLISEATKETSYPENYFIDYLHCIETH